MPGGMTLRPGYQKDHFFFNVIEDYDASLLPFYKNLYRENKQSGSPLQSYIIEETKGIDKLQRSHGLLNIMPHHLYQDRLQIYDEIWVLLTHMLKIYSRQGINISPLKESRNRYGAWLEEQKKTFNKTRSGSGNELDSQFQFMIQTGEFRTLIQNDKLSQFLEEVILERKCLNYKTLKLE